MSTRRGLPTRFDRKNRIRVRDNVKVKRITVMTPYVITGKDYNPTAFCTIIEAVVPVAGLIHNIMLSMKDPIDGVIITLYINEKEVVEDVYKQKVESGDILKYTLASSVADVVASKVLCSIAILPAYDNKFVLRTKVDKK